MNRDRYRLIVAWGFQILVWLLTVSGLALIVVSVLLPEGNTRDVTRAFGIALFPAGVVALLVSRLAGALTNILIGETIEETITKRLEQDMTKVDSTVRDGMSEISETISEGVEGIEQYMKGMSPLVCSAMELGLQNAYLTRSSALEEFAWFLDAEAGKTERGEYGRAWIVASSIKGFLEVASEKFDGRRMMERLARCNCDLRIMMTDPDIANLRAQQEGRGKGEIPEEVKMNLAYLKRIGVKRESVRFYPGTPTVFAVATGDRMLLNPYPYETEAFRCFSIVVHKTLNANADIYHQYLRYHFEDPWRRTTEISVNAWDTL
jgi:hypothetical protein